MGQLHRKIQAELKRLRAAVASGAWDTVIAFLKSVTVPQFLIAVREQKLLLKAQTPELRSHLGDQYRQSAIRVLGPDDSARESRYVQFLKTYHDSHSLLRSDLDVVVQTLPRTSSIQMLRTLDNLIMEHVQILNQNARHQLKSELGTLGNDPKATAVWSGRAIHESAGIAAEFLFAGARAVNFAMKRADPNLHQPLSSRLLGILRKNLQTLIAACHGLNGLEYAMDQVSFGEWYVSDVSPQSNHHRVRFEIVDARLGHARQMALRSMMHFSSVIGRDLTMLRTYLLDIIEVLTQAALDTMGLSNVQVLDAEKCIERAKQGMRREIELITAEDDLLHESASSNEIIYDYAAAATARWYGDMIGNLDNIWNDSALNLARTRTTVSHNAISSVLEKEHDRKGLRRALNSQSHSLPIRNHWQLLRNPFVSVAPGWSYHIRSLNTCLWTNAVRAKWLGKGRIGNRWGSAWEGHVADILKAYQWQVIGKGIRLKEHGQTITDADIIAVKGELALLAQVKALAGGATNPHDHWRHRQTITAGVRQAVTVRDYMCRNPNWLSTIAGHAQCKSVRIIQPLVITNLHTFNGWNVNDIPVLSLDGLMSILTGAKASLVTQAGKVIGETRFASSDPVPADEFVDLLYEPVDWRTAEEPMDVWHQSVPLGPWGLELEIPQLGKQYRIRRKRTPK